MKPIDQLVLDFALALCAAGFCMVALITGPGLGWFLFTLAVLLYAVLRVLSALHRLVPGGFGFADGGYVNEPKLDLAVSPEKGKQILRDLLKAQEGQGCR